MTRLCKDEGYKSRSVVGSWNTEVDTESSDHKDESKVDKPASILVIVRSVGKDNHRYSCRAVGCQSCNLGIGTFETVFTCKSRHERCQCRAADLLTLIHESG